MSAQGMVLPPHRRSDGEVASRWPHSFDDRVPRPLIERDSGDLYGDDHPARVAAHSPYLHDECGDGRHLFDVIESTIERETEEERPDGTWTYGYSYDFRTRLTCVRCGRIDEWEGTRTERKVGRVQPAPIAAGPYLAQHVSGDVEWGRDMTRWRVFVDGQPVGKIDWGRGSRGRAFHTARLDAWPAGERVEGKDPAAALRRLARTRAATNVQEA